MPRFPQKIPKYNSNTTKRASKGFTMIEVMTATVIMVIVITFALKIAVDTTQIYDRGMADLKTASESRAVLNAITQDLESAIIRNDNNYWMEVEHLEAVGNIPAANAPSIMLYASDPGRTKKTATDPERIPGTICAIKYQIAHRSPFTNPGDYSQQIYCLYRASIDAQGTFGSPNGNLESPLAKTIAGRELSEIWNGNAEVLDEKRIRETKSLRTWVTEIQNYKATGIVSLSLIFYYYNNETQKIEALVHADLANGVNEAHNNAKLNDIQIITYQNSVKIKAGKIIYDGTVISGNIKNIEVAVTTLSSDGDRTLRALQKTTNSPKINQDRFNKILLQDAYTYNTTIPFSQH